MKYTLLEAVKLILSSMDSDEVASISDTVESNQVALILKSVYYDCAVELGLEEQEKLFELTEASISQPVLMTIPTNVMHLSSVKYNNKLSTETLPNYTEVEYLPFEEFMEKQQGLSTDTNASSMTFSVNGESFETIYLDNAFPTSYTSISGQTLLFNSYLATEDSYLLKAKTMCLGTVYPAFTMSDSFVPDLNPTQFSYYINRAKVRAFSELKQVQNQEAASETRNQKIVIQKRKERTERDSSFSRIPKFGRQGPSFVTINKNLKQGS